MIAIPAPPGRSSTFDPSEATVIRIRTADAFSARDNDASIVRARAGDRSLRGGGDPARPAVARSAEDAPRPAPRETPSRESIDLTARAKPRTRAPSDEMTRARAPIDAARMMRDGYGEETPPHQHLTPTDDTKLVSPRVLRSGRTPLPQRAVGSTSASRSSSRPSTVPPPTPLAAQRPRPPTPAPLQLDLATTLPHAPAPAIAPAPLPPPQLPFAPAPPAGPYPSWGPPIAAQHPPRDATPTAQDSFDRPVYPQRPSMPQVSGFQPRPPRYGVKPWMLIVGAVVVALIAFAITRAFIR